MADTSSNDVAIRWCFAKKGAKKVVLRTITLYGQFRNVSIMQQVVVHALVPHTLLEVLPTLAFSCMSKKYNPFGSWQYFASLATCISPETNYYFEFITYCALLSVSSCKLRLRPASGYEELPFIFLTYVSQVLIMKPALWYFGFSTFNASFYCSVPLGPTKISLSVPSLVESHILSRPTNGGEPCELDW